MKASPKEIESAILPHPSSILKLILKSDLIDEEIIVEIINLLINNTASDKLNTTAVNKRSPDSVMKEIRHIVNDLGI